MNTIKLHNTLTSKKEELKTIKAGEVGLYVCGITPYDETHLGHGRCYVVFDVLKRVLMKAGYKVRHIQNFTDIDDKIIARALEKKSDPIAYANIFIESFFERMKALNVLSADVYPRVTTSMPLIISLVENLVLRGYAYNVDGNVFYRVRKFPVYGQLSKRNIDELAAGARVDINEKKEDPLDFALWKRAKPGEPFWHSPWGDGRPGWHIECSAMSMNELGEEFDIHGGGQDLIFPHHENEIAQSCGANGKNFAHVWVHNGFVTINQEKMSKSLGNFFTLKDILNKVDAMSVRYFLLGQHYKSPLNFSDQDLESTSQAWRERIVPALRIIEERVAHQKSDGAKEATRQKEATQLTEQFLNALYDDLNTPAALGFLNQFCSLIYKSQTEEGAQLSSAAWKSLQQMAQTMLDCLGLVLPTTESWADDILALVRERSEVRAAKNWKRSDEIRDLLKSKGLMVEDTSSGPRLKRIS